MIRMALLAATAMAACAAMPAHAQKLGDKAWAACVWQQAPVTAVNWLARPLPIWTTAMTAPEEVLGHRLAAICADKPADEDQPNREPKWKSVAQVLQATRPAQPGTADSDKSKILLCSQRAAGAIYRYDVVRAQGDQRVIAFQQYFTLTSGRLTRLGKDVRVRPFAESKITEQCQTIGSDGRLTDA